jgi:hypothetical protein
MHACRMGSTTCKLALVAALVGGTVADEATPRTPAERAAVIDALRRARAESEAAARRPENRTTLRDLPVGTRGRWEYKDGDFVFYRKQELVLRLRAPTMEKAKRSHDHHGTFDASCLVRADPRIVLEGMRGGWGVLETGKPSVECEHKSKTQLCRDRAAEKRAKGEWVPLAIMTVATGDTARRRLLDKARRSWRLWQAIGRRRDKSRQPAQRRAKRKPPVLNPAPPAPTSPVAQRPPPAPEQADQGLPWVQRRGKGTKLGPVWKSTSELGYLASTPSRADEVTGTTSLRWRRLFTPSRRGS